MQSKNGIPPAFRGSGPNDTVLTIQSDAAKRIRASIARPNRHNLCLAALIPPWREVSDTPRKFRYASRPSRMHGNSDRNSDLFVLAVI